MQGGCLCGSVRYEARGVASSATTCHCSICRRSTGAASVAWFTVSRGEFSFVTGEPATFRSSEHATRSFCSRCGTQLTFQSSRFEREIDVTIASLDEPEAVRPRDHTFVRSKLDWEPLCDGLPAFFEARPRDS
jgi:hypothetical protein